MGRPPLLPRSLSAPFFCPPSPCPSSSHCSHHHPCRPEPARLVAGQRSDHYFAGASIDAELGGMDTCR
eukprot:1474944-Pyramimonas_sp.AAC.1